MMTEKAIMELKGKVDSGELNTAQAESFSKESVAATAKIDALTVSDNELNHIKFHVGLYAQQQANIKQAQTVLGLLAGKYPQATARIISTGVIQVCLEGEKPFDEYDTGVIARQEMEPVKETEEGGKP